MMKSVTSINTSFFVFSYFTDPALSLTNKPFGTDRGAYSDQLVSASFM